MKSMIYHTKVTCKRTKSIWNNSIRNQNVEESLEMILSIYQIMKPIKVMFNNDDIDRVSIDDDQSAYSMDMLIISS